jgi:2-methylcitrate dehydratase PrpD
LHAADIESVALKVSPRALELTGIQSPPNGLKSKWSIYHSAAIALTDGTAGEHQYTDVRVNDPGVRDLRGRITATADAQLREIAARVSVTLRDGRVLAKHVERVTGSAENPMSDRDLEDKVRGLAHGILSEERTAALIAACWSLGELGDAAELARAAMPA